MECIDKYGVDEDIPKAENMSPVQSQASFEAKRLRPRTVKERLNSEF